MWSIAGLVIMNVVAQFAVYPILNKRLGVEEYGDIIYLLFIMNIIAISAGTACNYARMRKSADGENNFVNVVINNGAHETVGGMPTVVGQIDLVAVAKACGYPNAVCVDNFNDLDKELELAKNRDELRLIEVKCSIGARENLGRPTTTALENKNNFMDYLLSL